MIKWYYLNLNENESLTCDKCKKEVKEIAFIEQGIRSDFAFSQINCKPCFLEHAYSYFEGETKTYLLRMIDYLKDVGKIQ